MLLARRVARQPSLSSPQGHGVRGDLLSPGFWEELWVPLAGNRWGRGDVKRSAPATQDLSPTDGAPSCPRAFAQGIPASFSGLRPVHHSGLTLDVA